MIVPIHKRREFRVERARAKWYENNPRTFVLQTQDESLYQRDTPVLANGAETGLDPIAITPILEPVAPELLALVGDEVFRGGTGVVDGTFEEELNRYGCGIVPDCCDAHHASGVVVDDHRHPPAKRPALG